MTFNRVLILLSVICFVMAIFVTVPFNLLALIPQQEVTTG